jgi:hypothetical protein
MDRTTECERQREGTGREAVVRAMHHPLNTNVQMSALVDLTMHHANRTIMIVGATLAKHLTSSRR